MRSETFLCKAIARERIPRFQELLGYSDSCVNPIKALFVALRWADGLLLQWSDSSPADENDRNKIIDATAQATIDVLRVQERGYYSFLPYISFLVRVYQNYCLGCSAKWFIVTKIERRIQQAKGNSLRGGRTVNECQ